MNTAEPVLLFIINYAEGIILDSTTNLNAKDTAFEEVHESACYNTDKATYIGKSLIVEYLPTSDGASYYHENCTPLSDD